MSYFAAYSFGIGAVFVMTSALATVVPGCLSLKTIVYLFGVRMPETGLGVFGGFAGAPTMSEKYRLTYPFVTLTEKLRSIAYFTSADVTSRFTGGPNRTPLLDANGHRLAVSRDLRRPTRDQERS